jgi:hypothetical protein
MRDSTRLFELFGAVCLVFLLSVSGFAQSTTGTILGTVKDQSGAVLPGVEITVVNAGTNQSRATITNERGDYTAPQLAIGAYSVTASLPGFKTEVRQRIEIQVDQRARIDFTMEVGQVNDKIMVTEEAPLVQTSSASLGSVVDNQKIQQLPLNSRDFEKLALLVPGATPPQPGSSLAFRGGITIGGANERGNNFTLDGISNTTHNVFTYVYKPSVDEIQEFKVQPNAYDAEAGRGEGGQITVTTKSGSNAFHGTLFEFIRDDTMDARNFFDVQKAPFRRNQFGGNLGGPIEKNKTFFFFNYEGLRLRQTDTRTATVPTDAMRNGDFSAVAGGVRDPLTGTNFPNNVIPADRISPIGRKMLEFWPAPNRPTQPNDPRNYVASPISPDDSNQITARVDRTLSTKDNIFVRYSIYKDHFLDAYNQQSGISNLPGYARDDFQKNQAATISYTRVFSPNLLTTGKAGLSRLLQDRRTQDKTNYVPILGIPGLYIADEGITGVPDIRANGIERVGNPSNLPQGRSDMHYQYVNTTNWTKGDHSMKFGMDYARMQIFRRSWGNDRGVYNFDGRYSGQGVGDLLLGFPASSGRALGDSHAYLLERQWMFFYQDDWKVSPHLTLNLGLRYEWITPWWEKFNRMASYNAETGNFEIAGDPSQQREYLRAESLDPQLAQISAGLKFVDVGDKYLYNPDRNNFMPRIGFAWDPKGQGKFLVRGGVGTFYVTLTTAQNLSGTYPFRISQTFNNTTPPANTRIMPANTFSISNPFSGTISATINTESWQKDFQVGYVQKFSLGTQWEFLPNFVLDMDYSGSLTRKMWTTYNINSPLPGAGNVAMRRPIAGYGTISRTESSGTQSYNALETRLERRFSHGMTFINSYTWQKVLGTTVFGGDGASGYQDPRNMKANKGPESFDVRHRDTFSVVWELPVGNGRRFLGSASGVVDALLGGWQLSGIQTIQAGRPFTVVMSTDNSNTGLGSDRPNRIADGNLPQSERTIDRYFDINAFEAPAAFTFGNAGTGILYGPRYVNTDLSLNKNMKVKESAQLQVRAEFFNLLNHPTFDLPNRTFGNPQFGKVFRALPTQRNIQLGARFKF